MGSLHNEIGHVCGGGEYHKTSKPVKLPLHDLTCLDNVAVVLNLSYTIKKTTPWLWFWSRSTQEQWQAGLDLVFEKLFCHLRICLHFSAPCSASWFPGMVGNAVWVEPRRKQQNWKDRWWVVGQSGNLSSPAEEDFHLPAKHFSNRIPRTYPKLYPSLLRSHQR